VPGVGSALRSSPDDTPSFTNFLGYGDGERSEKVEIYRYGDDASNFETLS
jgi:hypothetical protein